MGHFKETDIAYIKKVRPSKTMKRGRNLLYPKIHIDIFFNLFGLNLLSGRTSFSGMLKVLMSEPSFRDQPQHVLRGWRTSRLI